MGFSPVHAEDFSIFFSNGSPLRFFFTFSKILAAPGLGAARSSSHRTKRHHREAAVPTIVCILHRRRREISVYPGPPQAKNPVINVFFPVINVSPLFFSFARHQRRPFSFSYVAAGITSQESRLSYEYSSSERLARAGRHPPSTRPLLCRCVVAPPRILSLTKCRRPLSSHICTCLLSAPAGKASPCRLHTRGCQ